METYTEEYKIRKQLERDLYFMRIAREVSKISRCLSRKIGSVLVKDGCVVSTGYNGPAKGVKHCNERNLDFFKELEISNKKEWVINASYDIKKDCPRRIFGYKSGQGLHLCQAGHSERNAIIQAARNGIATKGCTLYAFCGIPCKDCMIEIVNSGITELVFLKKDKSYDNYAEQIMRESGISTRTINEELV